MRFSIGTGTTLGCGILALLLSMLFTQVASRFLLQSIDAQLGIEQSPFNVFRFSWDTSNTTDLSAVEALCREHALTLAELDQSLRHDKTPINRLGTACGALLAYQRAPDRGNNPLPLLGPAPATPTNWLQLCIRGTESARADVGESGPTGSSGGASNNDPCDAWPPDLVWHSPDAIIDRIRSVTYRQGAIGLFLMQDVASTGLQGTVYDYRWPRLRGGWTDPNDVTWASADSDDSPQREGTDVAGTRAAQLTTLEKALSRLDKLLAPAIKDAERQFAGRRFLLRTLNNPFQFVILTVGMWGAVLYLYMLLMTVFPGTVRPHQLAAVIRANIPAGLLSESPKLTYSTELRNFTDELIADAHFGGKAFADTVVEWVPTMGFIGTVVGMIGAMDAVGDVVAADPGPELFAAMSVVTGELSLAFNTTFVALCMGLVLTYLRRATLARELRCVYKAVELVRSKK